MSTELQNILVRTFDEGRIIGQGAIGVVGYVDIGGMTYVYKRAPFVEGRSDPEMRREIETMRMISLSNNWLIHAPQYVESIDLEYNNVMYTFIIMTALGSFIDTKALKIKDFMVLLDDVLEQLTRIGESGVTSHNDTHVKNVLIGIADPDTDNFFDDFRGLITGMRAIIIDFGRASITPNYIKTTNSCSDLVSYVMSYVISKTGYLLSRRYDMIIEDRGNMMYSLYDDSGIIEDYNIYRLISLCDNIMVNSLGIDLDYLPEIYQSIRDSSFERNGEYKVMSTSPPYFFFRERHIQYISDITLLRSDESIPNCRKALYDMHHE